MTEQEQADKEYWNELAAVLGWTLYGWKDREHAQFFLGPDTFSNTLLENVTGKMRDDIMKVLGTVTVELIKSKSKTTREFSTMYESGGKPVFL